MQKEGGINLYGYVRNNPLENIDPFGLYNPISGPGGPVGPGSGLGDPSLYLPPFPPPRYYPTPTYPAPWPEMTWDPNSGNWSTDAGIQTDDGIFAFVLPFLTPEASVCPTKWKVGLHGPHHEFGPLGNLPHLQVNWWQRGVKGSGGVIRIPVPPGTPGFPR